MNRTVLSCALAVTAIGLIAAFVAGCDSDDGGDHNRYDHCCGAAHRPGKGGSRRVPRLSGGEVVSAGNG